MNKLFLIGGAPLTGKTTLAAKLATREHAVVMSTDNIRDWMRGVGAPDETGHLYTGQQQTAAEYYAVFDTPAKMLAEEIAQAQDTQKGVLVLLEVALPWDRLVLEGIAVTPALIPVLLKRFSHLKLHVTFLYDDNHERIKERVYTRGLWSSPGHTYPDSLKPDEVEWVIGYNEWYKVQAEKYGQHLTKLP